MAQTVQLALTTAGGTSSNIVVASGAKAMIGIYTDNAAGLPPTARCPLNMTTPSVADKLIVLDKATPVYLVEGPGTFTVTVPPDTVNIGVFSE